MSLRTRLRRWLGVHDYDPDIRRLDERLDAQRELLGGVFKRLETPTPPDVTPETIPAPVDRAIQARFGWNPAAAHVTRSTMMRFLADGGDPLEAIRAIDAHGEVIE